MALLKEVGDEGGVARSLGGLAWLAGSYAEARSLREENLAISRREGNRESVGWAAIQVGNAAQGEGDYAAARAAYEESLSIGQDLGYKRMVARSLTQLGDVALDEGKVGEARALFERSLPLWEEIGHKSGLMAALCGLGNVAGKEGASEEAESFLRQSLDVCREIGAQQGEARALQGLGAVAMARGHHDRAISLHRESLALFIGMEHLDGIAGSLRALGAIAAAQGRLSWAASLLTASEVLRERVSSILPPCDQAEFDAAMQQLRSGLGPDTFRREWEAGLRCTVAEAVRLAREVVQVEPALEGAGSRQGKGRRLLHRPTYPAGLSEREVEVLRLITAGRTNRDIADALIISPHTVARHVSSIFAKTGASNRAEAATYAAQHGLV
jgi:DNA-binding CsgD family transcriptional regulator